MAKKKTFKEWMNEVDKILEAKTGFGSIDLADTNYSEMYEEGKTPKGAATKALKFNSFF